ncbi:hypothetical protein C4K24_5529 [Pseudomonas chlororaphis subsp. aurantiaca]|nr:hypothetical protein C4K24_5529 [Pseudomonas chlororaphis subsp. aurantiaca]
MGDHPFLALRRGHASPFVIGVMNVQGRVQGSRQGSGGVE